MLHLKHLRAYIGDHLVVQDASCSVAPGQIVVLSGENGSGKSSFAHALMGSENMRVQAEAYTFLNQDMLTRLPHERAQLGLFVSAQEPVRIPGLSWRMFLEAALQERQKAAGEKPLTKEYMQALMESACQKAHMLSDVLERGVNEQHSGGEKKRMELLQWFLFSPVLSVFDELDAGLDRSLKKQVLEAIQEAKQAGQSVVVISHDEGWSKELLADQQWSMRGGILETTRNL